MCKTMVNQTKMTGKFWKEYQEKVRTSVIPYQWAALTDQLEDTEPSHAIKNFKIAAGMEEGEYYGMVFQDSDLYKWLESVAYSLDNHPDEELEKRADEVIDLLEKAQLDDGYLNTYYQLKEGLDKRWTNVRDNHELYCAGHMIEAAVAYYEVTGKTKFLAIVKRFADYINQIFGPEEGKIQGYPGHEEIELALVRLYLVTEKKEYLDLAHFFVEERGKEPNYFNEEAKKHGRDAQSWWHGDHEYSQAHAPIREQKEAVGHAVRAVYYYTAVADLARLKNDESLKEAVKTLWNNVVHQKMHVNGGMGASGWGEAFWENYDLPNDTTYNETCASVGFSFWAKRMLELEPHGQYADQLENAVYNGVLCGMDLKGKQFLYVNPLEINGPNACSRHDHKHVTPKRQKWFNCACCPPNLARLVASIGDYFTTVVEDTVYLNLYGQGKTTLDWKGIPVTIIQETLYPWNGEVSLSIHSEEFIEGTLAIRIPEWSEDTSLRLNGEKVLLNVENGYVYLDGTWGDNDTIHLSLDFTPKRVYANTKVTEDIGKVVIKRGPLVYAIEETDNGKDLGTYWLTEEPLKEVQTDELLEDAVYLKGIANQLVSPTEQTYSHQKPKFIEKEVTLIPYFMWGNRGYGEMRVWLNSTL